MLPHADTMTQARDELVQNIFYSPLFRKLLTLVPLLKNTLFRGSQGTFGTLNISRESMPLIPFHEGGGVLELDKLEEQSFQTGGRSSVWKHERTSIPNYQGREGAGASLELKYCRVSKVRRGGREVNLVWTNTKLSRQIHSEGVPKLKFQECGNNNQTSLSIKTSTRCTKGVKVFQLDSSKVVLALGSGKLCARKMRALLIHFKFVLNTSICWCWHWLGSL